jgi:hypothetical protein
VSADTQPNLKEVIVEKDFIDIRDDLDPALLEKVERGEPLTPQEVLSVKLALDLGNSAWCLSTVGMENRADEFQVTVRSIKEGGN